jgi:Dolichyl-phosphate-mannose-protein mannosyltransferase
MTSEPGAAVQLINRAISWSYHLFRAPDSQGGPLRSRALIAGCVTIFVVAFGVRLLHLQDSLIEMDWEDTLLIDLVKPYQNEARLILTEGRILFHNAVDPGDARMLVHPPGYSILVAASLKLFGESHTPLQMFQIAIDSLAAVLILIVAAAMLPRAVGIIAATLVAISPHLAYYSLWLSPDSLVVVPILTAVYLIIRERESAGLAGAMAAGACVGLSCWMRSNALLLAPWLGLIVLLLFPRGARSKNCIALVGATLIVISPITIRNLVVFHRFVPLSLGAGITMVEGIGDYDTANQFGLPKFDTDVRQFEAVEYNRPDYARNVWAPDGIDRDRARFARGLEVIKSNPVWFLGVMIRRAGFMLRYNDSQTHEWPFGTALAPPLEPEATFSLSTTVCDQMPSVWAATSQQLTTGGVFLSGAKTVTGAEGVDRIEWAASEDEFGDRFYSSIIAVDKNRDYVFAAPIDLSDGQLAAKITSADRRIALASRVVRGTRVRARKRKTRTSVPDAQSPGAEAVSAGTTNVVKLPFASGERTKVRFVLSNNSSAETAANLGRAELFECGPTRGVWTRYPRRLIRGLQRNLFTTGRMLTLVVIGVALLVIARQGRALAFLLAVPAYYLAAQSALHTEYRYIVAIHYLLAVMAATTLYFAAAVLMKSVSIARLRFKAARAH